MDQPTNYAILQNGVVTNVIWLCSSNAGDFPSAVSVQGRLVAVGDTYENGVFYRSGEPVPTEEERIALLEAELE
ncbi:MAG TPA: hypothetical protein VN453_01515 [Feifaniaceae bacterium]|nr:hypothetical protein [Feifaniaceae bacterium]